VPFSTQEWQNWIMQEGSPRTMTDGCFVLCETGVHTVDVRSFEHTLLPKYTADPLVCFSIPCVESKSKSEMKVTYFLLMGPLFIFMLKGPRVRGTHPFGISLFVISMQFNDIINH
jgi:hypothetical protein